MAKLVQYYVGGECEATLIKAFQYEARGFLVGKIDVINPAEKNISKLRISQLKKETTVVLVYDTDVANERIIDENVRLLKKSGNIKAIYHVQSIDNFEDEIVYSSKISSINDVFKTRNINEFKTKFLTHKDIVKKLLSVGFDIKMIWTRKSKKITKYQNQGDKIKTNKKK